MEMILLLPHLLLLFCPCPCPYRRRPLRPRPRPPRPRPPRPRPPRPPPPPPSLFCGASDALVAPADTEKLHPDRRVAHKK